MPRFDPLSRVLGGLAAILGTIAAAVYWRAGLSLSHYDAKAHLVVARRIFDSLTPGWEQIGAVWLPLPHLLNALPVQIDWLYRTGASAIAISIVSFAITVACIVRHRPRASPDRGPAPFSPRRSSRSIRTCCICRARR